MDQFRFLKASFRLIVLEAMAIIRIVTFIKSLFYNPLLFGACSTSMKLSIYAPYVKMTLLGPI